MSSASPGVAVAVKVAPDPAATIVSRGRFSSWLATVDHKRIGIMYILTSLFFFVAGGIIALLMRSQLARPNEHVFTRDTYDQMFTMHGTTMIFLVVVPVFAGLANYLVPLMIGARDMAFPRLNAASYWFYLLGGGVLYASWFSGAGGARAGVSPSGGVVWGAAAPRARADTATRHSPSALSSRATARTSGSSRSI